MVLNKMEKDEIRPERKTGLVSLYNLPSGIFGRGTGEEWEQKDMV